VQLSDALADIGAATDERSAARAAASAARTLFDAGRAAVYMRVPTLGWRRSGSVQGSRLPGVVPDVADEVRRLPGDLVDIDLQSDDRDALTLFRELGIANIIAAAIAPNDDLFGYITVFDPRNADDRRTRDALTVMAMHLGSVLERIAGADRFVAVADAIPQLVWTTLPDGSIEWCNGRWTAYTGLSLEAMRGPDGVRAAIHPDDLESIDREWDRVRDAGEDFDLAYRLRAGNGSYRWHLTRATAMRDRGGRIIRWFGTATDIDERHRNEFASSFLIRASAAIGSSLRLEETLQNLVDVAVPELGDWCVVAMPHASGVVRTAAAAHVDVDRRQVLLETPFPPAGASITLPIAIGGETIGEVAFGYDGGGRGYDESLVRTALDLTGRAAAAIENARRYEREQRVADALQRALLPPYLPSARGLRFHAVYRPNAQEANVGGDWYDAFELPSGRIAISIGDVGGHGLEAAVTMGRVREIIRTAAIGDEDPGTILDRTDDVLTLGGGETMVTAIVGVIDREALTFTYASAGHPAPLVTGADRTVRVLPAGDVPLGMRFQQAYTTHTIEIVPESLIVAYTDGLLEFDRDVIRGEARIVAAVADELQHPHPSRADAIVGRIIEGQAFDDIALLAVSIDPVEAPVLAVTFDAVPETSPQARAVVSAFASKLALGEDRLFDLLLAVGEAVNNAIEHAYADGTPGTFALRAMRLDGSLVIEIEDRGRWRRRNRPIPSDGLSERGRGIALMRALCDDVDLSRTATGTVVRLEMRGVR
jgi:PAS domain S-box-containing protein